MEGSIRLPRPIQKLLYKYVLLFYKSMDKLIVVNPSFIPKLEECGIPAEKIEYIPNFVDDEQFYPMGEKERMDARRAFGLDTEKFMVLCAGQMQKRKGFLDFLETARRCPDMQFVWAGGFSFGKITDGYDEIRHAAEHLPVNVTLTGIVPREKMNSLYNAADVFFLPSFDELFPMTLLESMCCHKPILVRDLDLYPPPLHFGRVLYCRQRCGRLCAPASRADRPGRACCGFCPLSQRASALYQSGGAFLLEELLCLFAAADTAGAAGEGGFSPMSIRGGKIISTAVTIVGILLSLVLVIIGLKMGVFTSPETLQIFLRGAGFGLR